MDIAKRFKENPLLKPSDIKPSIEGMVIECLLNPGVFEYEGKTWLLVRVAERPVQKEGKTSFPVYDENGQINIMEFDNSSPDLDLSDPRVIIYKGDYYLTTMSHLRLMCSDNGKDFYEPEGNTILLGEGAHETFGIEDCRVAQIGDTYYLTFTSVSPLAVAVGMRSTKDWKTFHHHGLILPAHNKDTAIFNEKINNKYYALHRPSSPELGGNYIWIAESPDLEHWGKHQCIATTRAGMWDCVRVGAGAAPIKTPKGWLEIYHGANEAHRYCLGALLLDLEDPSKVLARSQEPIMEPVMDYEKTGFFGNVVFTNGQVVKGDEVTIYYGASDEIVGGATFSIQEILNTLC